MVARVGLEAEEQRFAVPEQIALRDLAIREQFARTMLVLFGATTIQLGAVIDTIARAIFPNTTRLSAS